MTNKMTDDNEIPVDMDIEGSTQEVLDETINEESSDVTDDLDDDDELEEDTDDDDDDDIVE